MKKIETKDYVSKPCQVSLKTSYLKTVLTGPNYENPSVHTI